MALEKTHVLVTGSRTWTDMPTIEKELKKLSLDEHILVHGGARGVDSIAGYLWKKMGGEAMVCRVEKEDWEKYGLAAGPRRNKHMLDNYPIKKALAFNKGNSKGTMHMIKLLKDAKVPLVAEYYID